MVAHVYLTPMEQEREFLGHLHQIRELGASRGRVIMLGDYNARLGHDSMKRLREKRCGKVH